MTSYLAMGSTCVAVSIACSAVPACKKTRPRQQRWRCLDVLDATIALFGHKAGLANNVLTTLSFLIRVLQLGHKLGSGCPPQQASWQRPMYNQPRADTCHHGHSCTGSCLTHWNQGIRQIQFVWVSCSYKPTPCMLLIVRCVAENIHLG